MASFGEIRAVDIPLCDPYRKKMSASINGIKTFSFGQDLVFEAYVQFKEYIGFAKCMHALQGKKLVFLEGDKAWSATIKVLPSSHIFLIISFSSFSSSCFV